jgi:hypothetical protein
MNAKVRKLNLNPLKAGPIRAEGAIEHIYLDDELTQVVCRHGPMPIDAMGALAFFWCVECNVKVSSSFVR